MAEILVPPGGHTALSDPASVLLELVDESRQHAGMTEAEAYAFLAGAGRDTSELPKIAVAGFWTKRDEALHPRDDAGRFTDKIELTENHLRSGASVSSDNEGRYVERQPVTPNDVLGMTKNGRRRILMGPGWSGILEERDGDEWRQVETSKHYFDMIDRHRDDKDKFLVPKRGEDRRLPSVTRRSTPTQASPEIARRFTDAARGREILAQVRDLDSFEAPVRNALIGYRSEDYKKINGTLHAGGAGDPGIDQAMRESQLENDVVVWRGGRNGAKRFGAAWDTQLGSMIGVEYRDLAYASTSVDPSIASAFASPDDDGFLVKILAPRGTRAVGLTPSSMTNGEDELLLDRGLRYRIVGDHIEHGIRTFDVEVIA